jgi:hypothetical protein
MVYVSGMETLLSRMEDRHFWIAYFDIADWRQSSPIPTLRAEGYRVGDPIVYDHLGNRIVLLEVWKQ